MFILMELTAVSGPLVGVIANTRNTVTCAMAVQRLSWDTNSILAPLMPLHHAFSSYGGKLVTEGMAHAQSSQVLNLM